MCQLPPKEVRCRIEKKNKFFDVSCL